MVGTVVDARQSEQEVGMPGWLQRVIGRSDRGQLRVGGSDDTEHLDRFVQTRRGVEAFVEPRTTVTDTTVLLVAIDGEWTRRRVNGPRGAADFARRNAIPLYEAAVVGYPQRMRDYNNRQRARTDAQQQSPPPTGSGA